MTLPRWFTPFKWYRDDWPNRFIVRLFVGVAAAALMMFVFVLVGSSFIPPDILAAREAGIAALPEWEIEIWQKVVVGFMSMPFYYFIGDSVIKHIAHWCGLGATR